MKTHELERKLRYAGCYLAKHGKKHDQWYSPITQKTFPVPRHGPQEMPHGTVLSIEKESGVKL